MSAGRRPDLANLRRALLCRGESAGGYCLGSSNSVPDYVPLENYRAMQEACLKYGAYPIRL